MKKTIAILLVLVIGMVGVWAASVGTADLLLTTTVPPIDAMAIYAADYTDPVTSLTDTEFTSFTDSATAVELDVDDMNTAQPVGKLYTYSNRRVYRVEITATPLSSAAGGSTNYIDYTVSGGKNVDLDDTTYSTHGAETANPASVFYAKSAASAGAEMGANGQLISVKIDTDYSTVAAGGYNGAITFNYIAE